MPLNGIITISPSRLTLPVHNVRERMAQFQWRWRARSTRCVQHRPTTPAAALLGQQHQSSVQIRAHASPVACVRATYFPPATGEEQFDARSLSRALGLLLCVCTLRRMNALCRVLAAAAVVPVAKSGCNCIAPHSSTSHNVLFAPSSGGPVASRQWSRFTHRMRKIECSPAWTISIRLAIPCFVKWVGGDATDRHFRLPTLDAILVLGECWYSLHRPFTE